MELPEGIYSASGDRRRPPNRYFAFHWRKLWRDWMQKHLPANRQVSFDRRNLFIFPTKAGFSFLAVLTLLLLVAINFENSLVYAFTFWLAGIFVVSIIHTFLNLNGLTIKGYDAKPCFAGSDATFHFLLSSNTRPHIGLNLSWQAIASERVDIPAEKQLRLQLRYRCGPRGECLPGRIKIESRYPLGLIRCWTWVDLDQKVIVYPRPDAEAQNIRTARLSSEQTGQQGQINVGSDDFYSLRQFQPGDNLKSVAWKLYAKTDRINIKQFIDFEDQRMWIDWDDTNGSDERRLSQLCHLALEAENGVFEYGLKLPGLTISPAKGDVHLHALLRELALFTRETGSTQANTQQGSERGHTMQAPSEKAKAVST